MTLEDNHGPLRPHVDRLITELDGFVERLEHGEVMHVQHTEFGVRARWLGYQLAASLNLSDRFAYPAAFAVMRSALEHHLLDSLLFLADRYLQSMTGVTEAEWLEDQEARERGEDWTQNVIDWNWHRGALRIVRSGPHFSGAEGGLSIYYGLFEQFDPFRGPPEEQPFLAGEFTEAEIHERWARQQRALYSEGFRWKALRDNLVLNGLFDELQMIQLNVHFRFLSAFVHPTSSAYELLYGRNIPPRLQYYDHYASELVLSYAASIASSEIDRLRRMAAREPIVNIRGEDELRVLLERNALLCRYFWWPGEGPTDFDRVEEANDRGMVDGRLVRVGDPGRLRPEELVDEDVRYYRNPYTRMKALHRGIDELTGFRWNSPWPRGDAGWL